MIGDDAERGSLKTVVRLGSTAFQAAYSLYASTGSLKTVVRFG